MNHQDKDAGYHYLIGKCYLYGFGVQRNFELSAEHFIKVGEKSEYAQFYLGEYYENYKQDLDKAYACYKLATNEGHAGALYKMVKACALGIDVEKNPTQAAHFFQKLLESEVTSTNKWAKDAHTCHDSSKAHFGLLFLSSILRPFSDKRFWYFFFSNKIIESF